MCKDNNLQFLDRNEERNIPADLEAVSKSDKATERVKTTLYNCAERNQQIPLRSITCFLSDKDY